MTSCFLAIPVPYYFTDKNNEQLLNVFVPDGYSCIVVVNDTFHTYFKSSTIFIKDYYNASNEEIKEIKILLSSLFDTKCTYEYKLKMEYY